MDIHLEGIEKTSFENGDVLHLLEEISDRKISVALSLPPWMEDYWKENNAEVIKQVRKIVRIPGNVLGQQGNTHKCRKGHVCVDEWHENRCPYGGSPRKEEQRELMETGRQRLIDLIGVSPQLYVPPNHLFNHNTLEAASEMGYKFFAVKAVIPLQPYRFGNLIVIPERDLTKGQLNGAAAYIHYDEIDANKDHYREAVRRASPLDKVRPEFVNPDKIFLNNSLVLGWKVMRDVIKLPKRLKKMKASA